MRTIIIQGLAGLLWLTLAACPGNGSGADADVEPDADGVDEDGAPDADADDDNGGDGEADVLIDLDRADWVFELFQGSADEALELANRINVRSVVVR